MKKVLGVFLGLIALMVIGVIGVFALSNTSAGPASDIAKTAKAAATNAVFDTTGIKDQVKNTVEASRETIAAATGLSAEQVDTAIESLAIDQWQATTLPSDAVEADNVNGSDFGFDGTVTTYTDPSYVTLSIYGQTITLSVPESAREYLDYMTPTP